MPTVPSLEQRIQTQALPDVQATTGGATTTTFGADQQINQASSQLAQMVGQIGAE